ncbi:MAG: response regulator transcription factor [Cyclobacteriaceae bacterium]|nr:response regulator transcription factor [Cyclobacteriaceae bacterium]
MKCQCIIIDDEQPARELLLLYAEQIPGLEVIGTFDNAFSGFTFLQTNHVNLMFLDIQMPRMSGLELLHSLKYPPKVIITTAFRDYALDAFELDVIDYLLKPISQNRFLKSISKFHSYTDKPLTQPEISAYEQTYIFLKVGKEQVKVYLKDIQYIEGLKDYIKVHTIDKMLVAYDRLGYMEEKLPDMHFLRVHKSYIVALDKINRFNHDSLHIGNREIPVGRVYKQNFITALKSK